jgi:hypothetical protein
MKRYSSHTLGLLPLLLATVACGSADDERQPGGAPAEPTTPIPGNEPGPGEELGDPGGPEIALDECGLATNYRGDEYCILPPPEAEGFQIHYGPTDYDDPDDVAPYLLAPGDESNLFEPAVSGNTSDVFFYRRQYRMRPGSHHLIVSESSGGTTSFTGLGRRLGGSQNVAKDTPTREAPENAGLGMPLVAEAPLSLNLHHFNGSGEPILREAWVNFWYVDEAEVVNEAQEMFLWAQGTSVAPGSTLNVTGHWDIDADGRVLTMYGHRHSNTPRFTAYHVRDGSRTLVYDDFDWVEPAVFEFNSVTENPTPDAERLRSGAISGPFELLQGDALEWECEIVNERDYTISFGQNEAESSEMCILVGDAIGPALLGVDFGF